MSVSLDSQEHIPNPLSNLITTISSYDVNVLLAAIISLLLVILFVLLLHLYAKWFLAQPRRHTQSPSLSHVLPHDHFHASFTFEATFSNTTPSSKGLDPSAISSIPSFVYKVEKQGLEYCVICLSPFEDNDIGRNLIKCGHCFHVECIDMWLHSHSNCPICRAPAMLNHHETSTDHADSQTGSLMESVGELLNVGDNLNDSIQVAIDDVSASSSIGCSLKRMLSFSRNRSERKAFASSNTSELPL